MLEKTNSCLLYAKLYLPHQFSASLMNLRCFPFCYSNNRKETETFVKIKILTIEFHHTQSENKTLIVKCKVWKQYTRMAIKMKCQIDVSFLFFIIVTNDSCLSGELKAKCQYFIYCMCAHS